MRSEVGWRGPSNSVFMRQTNTATVQRHKQARHTRRTLRNLRGKLRHHRGFCIGISAERPETRQRWLLRMSFHLQQKGLLTNCFFSEPARSCQWPPRVKVQTTRPDITHFGPRERCGYCWYSLAKNGVASVNRKLAPTTRFIEQRSCRVVLSVCPARLSYHSLFIHSR